MGVAAMNEILTKAELLRTSPQPATRFPVSS